MRPIISFFSSILFRLCLVSVFSLFSLTGFAQMSGTYLVDQDDVSGSPGIFNSWQEAADSLVLHGISADVTVNFKTGDYDRNVTLSPIPGTGPTAGVVFQSETGDSNDVRFKFAGYDTANHIVNIRGASYITIQNLQFNATLGSSGKARIIILTNACHHVTVRNNSFFSIDSWAGGGEAISTYSHNVSYIYINNNLISKGEVAISIHGKSDEYLSEIHISNNIAENARVKGMSFGYIDGLVLSGNTINIDTWEDRNGIYLLLCSGALRVMGNKIDVRQPGYGGALYMDRCLGDPTGPGRGLVANNTIRANMRDADTEAWEIRSSENQRIYHNTIRVRGATQIWSAGLRMDNTDYHAMSGIDIQNNTFMNVSRGYTVYITSKGYVSNLSNNNYFTTGNQFIRYGGSYPNTIEAHISANGEPGAVSVNPVLGDVNLHSTSIWLDSAGADLSADVTVDIDGVPRTSTPSIGAHQYTGVGEPMAGDYYVGGTGADFAGFNEAVTAVENYGISAAVTLNLRDAAPFEEKSSMVAIPGAGPDKRVTIQSDPANTTQAIISYAGTYDNDYTFQFVRAHYITLKNLTLAAANQTYGTIVRFIGYCKSDSIVNCKIEGLGRSSSDDLIVSYEQSLEDIHFVDNTLNNGKRGFYINSYQYGFCKNISFLNNTFIDQYTTGINFNEWLKPMRIEGNYFRTESGASNYQAINLNNSDEQFQIIGNTIINNSGRYGGIYIGDCDANSSFPNQIINNFISVGGNTDVTGIFTQGAAYVDIIHNNISILASNSHVECAAYRDENGSNIRLLNNNLINFGYGFAIKTNNASAIIESDYNNLFAVDRFLTEMNGDNPSLARHQDKNGSKDANSVSVNPNYLSSSDLHVNSSFIDGKGSTGTTGVLYDIDGNPRLNPPDIGADEFSASRSPIPAGEYTIGAGGDYTKVKEAFDSLQLRGIAGPVTMKIKPGTYNEYIGRIYEIPGTSLQDTIVINSESGNPANTIIAYNTNSSNNGMLKFRGTDHVTIKDLTIAAQGTSEGRPVFVRGTATDLKFINNRLTSSNPNRALFWVNDAIATRMQIIDNYFEGGHTGISFRGYQYWYPADALISGNFIFDPVDYGIYVKYVANPKVVGNEIINQGNTFWRGITMDWCNGKLVVSENKINSRGSDKGIYLYECESSTPDYGLITNNQIHIDAGTSTAYGIHLHYSDRQHLYHNSINISKSSASNGRGIFIQDNNRYLNIMNNVVNGGPSGYAYWVNDPNDIDTSDFNNFYSEGANLANWGGARADLLALQTASGKDVSSMSADPLFYSNDDLHSKQKDMYQAGTRRIDVPLDADSVMRDLSKPDIGAYEFTCVAPTFNVWTSPSCFGDSTIIIDSSLNIAGGSLRGWDLDNDVKIDVITENDFEKIMWQFSEPGINTINYVVQQIAGCDTVEQIDVMITPSPMLEIETKGASCEAADGWAEVTVTNIPGPFTYRWSNKQEESRATNLAIGGYSVAVTDETAGCTSDSSINIGDEIELTISDIKPSSCSTPTGSATVTVSGGSSPYRYSWSNGDTLATSNSLPAGPNTVNIFDSKGCASRASVDILSEGGPQITPVVENNACFGEMNGSINLSITGGKAPYKFKWSNGETTEDIENLPAGIYNVTVEDSDECLASASIQIAQPPIISISPIVTPATCKGSDGIAVAVASGGLTPYTYEWSTGGTFKIEEGLSAGIYSVIVTDRNGCQIKEPVIVNEVGAPEVSIAAVEGVGCTTTDNGSISINVKNAGFFPVYDWSTDDGNGLSPTDTDTQTGLTIGTYKVTVTKDGCKGFAQAQVQKEPPETPSICLVTVDTATDMNLIVWEKSDKADLAYYNVYRESSVRGEFQVIGTVGIDEESIFVDSVADPFIRSWRYKLSLVDNCGNESELSPHHKTMHMTMNTGALGNTVNLLWDHYEGFEVNTYNILKLDANNNWNSLQAMTSDNISLTDIAPIEDPWYFVEIEAPSGGCTTTDKKAATYNYSRSNRKTKFKSEGTFMDNLMNISNFSIYPNPGTGVFNMSMDLNNLDNISVKIFDMSGKLVLTWEEKNVPYHIDTQFDLSGLADGLYQFHVRTSNAMLHRILIKE